MQKHTKILTGILIGIIIVWTIYFSVFLFSDTHGLGIQFSPEERLMRCFQEQGVHLYTAEECPRCEAQRKSLQGLDEYVPTTNCSADPGACSRLLSLPAWVFNGTAAYRIYNAEDIILITGCGEQ